MRGRRWAAVILGIATLSLSGCAPDRQGAAEAIDAAVAQLPGVGSSTFNYESGWPKGDERFALTAVMRDNATPDQAAAVGETLSERLTESGLATSDVTLEVKYRVQDRMNNIPLSSIAMFAVDPAGRPAMADGLHEWLAIAQSPGVQSVRLNRPGNAVDITIATDATDSGLAALVAAHPDARGAEWIVVGGSITETSIYAAGHPEAYRVKGTIPDATLRDTWTRIVGEVGATGQITAETDMSRTDVRTTVDLNFPTSRDNEQGIAQAWLAIPLMEKLPQPARVDFDGATFMLGGCSAAEPDRTSPPLETELRQKYEKC